MVEACPTASTTCSHVRLLNIRDERTKQKFSWLACLDNSGLTTKTTDTFQTHLVGQLYQALHHNCPSSYQFDSQVNLTDLNTGPSLKYTYRAGVLKLFVREKKKNKTQNHTHAHKHSVMSHSHMYEVCTLHHGIKCVTLLTHLHMTSCVSRTLHISGFLFCPSYEMG